MKTICLEVKEDIFTEADEAVYNKSVNELRRGKAIDLEQAKKELLSVSSKNFKNCL